MIKIDWKRFIYNRIWFGYGRGASYNIIDGWKWQWIKVK
jgi:hypothetical protein